MQIRNDWTRGEIRGIYNLPLPELIFQAQNNSSRISQAGRSAALPLLSIKTGGCPGGLRLLPAERALRNRRRAARN